MMTQAFVGGVFLAVIEGVSHVVNSMMLKRQQDEMLNQEARLWSKGSSSPPPSAPQLLGPAPTDNDVEDFDFDAREDFEASV